MIIRDIEQIIRGRIGKGKAIIITGARQVGKTTLLKHILSDYRQNETQFWNCDEPDIRLMLQNANSGQLKAMAGKSKIIVIDEAQRIQGIGLTLKLLHDSMPHIQFAITGSSSLDLSDTIKEPLTGRKFEYSLYPFSTAELARNSSPIEEIRMLNSRLVYGFYPDVVNNPGDEQEILMNLASSYLYKDVFEFQGIRKHSIIEKLLQALALQVGSEVSFNELGRLLGINVLTVQKYVDLLEKAYIVFHLSSYSRNLRNELKKSIKIYFYDNGIRNSIIANFSMPDLRSDIGALWENFLISERIKNNAFNNIKARHYFWRTTQKQEIDFLEEKNGIIQAWEFKYSAKKGNAKCPVTFAKAYPEIKYGVITRENYFGFVSGENQGQ
ncbi:MAG: ATP-binding protein [Elusimicrobiales bacterium]|nr:ATP-binding protein [Elusimicrobiales bacterium]